MARRRFFVPAIRQGRAELVGDDALHLTRVLRVEAGQRYEISDNQRPFLAEVTTARKSLVEFAVLEEIAPTPLRPHMVLLASLVKFDRLEWTLEKATELGVAEIQLVQSERSEHGLEKAAVKRLPRWERVLQESAQQCRRDSLPVLHGTVRLETALRMEADQRYALEEERGAQPLSRALPQVRRPDARVALLLGPEGGWADRERDAIRAADWRPVSLGPLVLRSETAATAGLAVITAAWA